jgi:hypothetical protein
MSVSSIAELARFVRHRIRSGEEDDPLPEKADTSEVRRRPRGDAPSLRPPTLMIDLLFGALMLFAFQMGDPNARQVVPRDVELPTSDESAGDSPAELLPLKPVKAGEKWAYELPSGERVGAEAVIEAVRSGKKTPILVVSKSASVQSYLDAEQPLRQRGLKVGLAVELEQGAER